MPPTPPTPHTPPTIDATPIEPRDLPSVYALIATCYEEFGFTLNLDDECEQHLKDPRGYFRAHGGDYWVVRDDAGVVRATCALYLHSEGTPAVGELKSMYVDSAWRRRGVGRALTTMVMREAAARGCRVMELWSDTRFGPAHRMYESLGFVRIGEREIHDSNNSVEYGFRRGLEDGV
jgi:putative acetyltransferase